jgi:hypothetical protein
MSAAPRSSRQCCSCQAVAPERSCPRCGPETSAQLPNVREFLLGFLLHYLAAEGRRWCALSTLIFHPGRLRLEYPPNRRRAYRLKGRALGIADLVTRAAATVLIAGSAHVA